MKIASVEGFPLRVGDQNQLLIKVKSTCGVVGWGESGLTSRELAVMGTLSDLGDFLEGRDPLRPAVVWEDLHLRPGFARDRVGMALISAVDIALHDLAGKALDVPVHRLLGGARRSRVPTFGCVRADDTETLIGFAQEAADVGWRCLRLGWRTDAPEIFDPQDAIVFAGEFLPAARRALGTQIMLGIDMHHRLSIGEAARFCARMPAGVLDFLEEPIRDESPSAYVALRRMTGIPLAIGEEFTSRWQFLPYVEQGLCDFARIDVCNVGGLTEAMRVAGWCSAHGIQVMPHNPLGPICTAASVHMAAAMPNHAFLECWETPHDDNAARQSSPVFRRALKLDGADYPVPDAPGLGVDIDETSLAKASGFEYFEMPHLRRSDGSFTNW
ncbi:mandelate racemase/muconate lactonizing enzyme family protein [Rubellimicrobium roseum]|uniref:Mandelate racemase/muconate lactonizing enzyme family protein n=1 Tax=Rubellimicrobium roseum TaxID=687525 RepID=A0A5C4N3E6_9RHOB|nr:mandelate racemase/muconate lactonizing enzyme family protein [Rubellimicrobium roseum]TNC60047.1 mandelate racemase/muconate lactonizing enzyme family protein [Rubellimicrobium roseum]